MLNAIRGKIFFGMITFDDFNKLSKLFLISFKT